MIPTMTLAENKARKPRRDCKYTPAERAVMSEFKEEYLLHSTPAARGHIFRSKILPAIFNYWTVTDKIESIKADMEKEVKVRELSECHATHLISCTFRH
jgi:hypothetical protein